MESGGCRNLRRHVQRRVFNRDRHADGCGAGRPHAHKVSDTLCLDDIRIHGGRQEVQTKNGNWIKVDKPELKKTEGCLRAYDDDMKNFKDITDNLQKSDELEIPGKVIIKDDYDEFIENK